MTKITQENIDSIPFLKTTFESRLYRKLLPVFMDYANQGAIMDVKTGMHDLLELACQYCGISLTYRTVAFDFAWALLSSVPEYWTDEERASVFCDLNDHIQEFYPENNGRFDDYDVAVLSEEDYFSVAVQMIKDREVEAEKLPIFCYAGYLFFEDMI
jgi:hypothetical protein